MAGVAVPGGFFVFRDAVSEEAWGELRSYLGLLIEENNILVPGLEGTAAARTSDNNDNEINRGAESIPWESTPFPQNRPVVQFGAARYDYETDTVVATTSSSSSDEGSCSCLVPKLPERFRALLLAPSKDRFARDETIEGIVDDIENGFEQCIVNVYRADNAGSGKPQSMTAGIPSTIPTNNTVGAANANANENGSIGSSIPWHVDDPAFGPVILVFTFGESRPLCMRRKRSGVSSSSNNNNNNVDDKSESDNKPNDVDGNGDTVVSDLCNRNRNRNRNKNNNNNNNNNNNDDDDDDNDDYSYFTAHPPHRSCYVLSGPARHEWEHSIPRGSGWRSVLWHFVRSNAAGNRSLAAPGTDHTHPKHFPSSAFEVETDATVYKHKGYQWKQVEEFKKETRLTETHDPKLYDSNCRNFKTIVDTDVCNGWRRTKKRRVNIQERLSREKCREILDPNTKNHIMLVKHKVLHLAELKGGLSYSKQGS
eukprot:jgi/Psemu1/15909/gm1.15909_g